MTPAQLQEAVKGIVAQAQADSRAASISRNIAALKDDLASAMIRSSGWLTPSEKLAVLHRTSHWKTIRSRERVDLLMAAGCYREAIPIFESFSHWRKIGDALLALGDVEAARRNYERGENKSTAKNYAAFRAGPDTDRLIALAIGRNDWRETLSLIQRGKPDPLGKTDVIFSGGNRAKGPLVKLCAHASWKLGDASILADMPRMFAMKEAELKVIFANATTGAFERDVAKLANPGLLEIKPAELRDVLRAGDTPAVAHVVRFFANLDAGFEETLTDIETWRTSGKSENLDRAIYWLTCLGSYEVFQALLFRVRNALDAWISPHPTDVSFYVSHPWLMRGCIRELLTDLIREKSEPSPPVLLSCAIQHSASPFEINFEDLDSKAQHMEQIRSQPIWAEAVVSAWAAGGALTKHWKQICKAGSVDTRTDPRRLPAYSALCEELIDLLEAAWLRDFNEIRWKAEEAAYLSLKGLLPDAEIIRHAQPSWLAPQHLDIFLPEHGVAIEYQGVQHYQPVAIFGGEAGFVATVERDQRKRQICDLAGVRLEYIRYDEAVDDRLRQIALRCGAKTIASSSARRGTDG